MVLDRGNDQGSEVCMTPEPAKTKEPAKEEALNKWQEYERRKAELPSDLKPFDYLDACNKIAHELGI